MFLDYVDYLALVRLYDMTDNLASFQPHHLAMFFGQAPKTSASRVSRLLVGSGGVIETSSNSYSMGCLRPGTGSMSANHGECRVGRAGKTVLHSKGQGYFCSRVRGCMTNGFEDEDRFDVEIHETSVGRDERPSEAVVRTTAALLDRDPMELNPLYGAVDPDALDAMVAHAQRVNTDSQPILSFSYHGYRVLVDATGRITVTAEAGPDVERAESR